MMSTKTFIDQKIAEFGILGSNNRVTESTRWEPIPALTYELTKANHFRFGFDGAEFNARTSSSALYWVDYGRATRAHGGFISELRRALSEAHETHGPLSVTNSGSAISKVIICTAREMRVPIEFDYGRDRGVWRAATRPYRAARRARENDVAGIYRVRRVVLSRCRMYRSLDGLGSLPRRGLERSAYIL